MAALASRLSIGVARLPKHSFHFVFCPPGLLELRSSQGLKPAVFATLSPVLIELTSSVPLAPHQIHKEPPLRGGSLCIGVARFELTTFCSQSRRSTRLSYTPKCSKYNKKSPIFEHYDCFFSTKSFFYKKLYFCAVKILTFAQLCIIFYT